MPKKALTAKELMKLSMVGQETMENRQHLGGPDFYTAVTNFLKPLDEVGQEIKKDPFGVFSLGTDPLSLGDLALRVANKVPAFKNWQEGIDANIAASKARGEHLFHGMEIGEPNRGAVKFSIGKMGMPVLRDQHGLQFAPADASYFGPTSTSQQDNLSIIRKLLESSDINESMFLGDVGEVFGLKAPGKRAVLGNDHLGQDFEHPARLADLDPTLVRNVREALGRIPTVAKNRVFVDPTLISKKGALGMAHPAYYAPWAAVAPSSWIHEALPHELQHLNDFSTNRMLLTQGAGDYARAARGHQYSLENLGNEYILEARAELQARRFSNWLRTNGVWHFWDDPTGIWPNR